MTRFIGLTGGIGAGKSAALAAFTRLGVPALSTDEVTHELLTTGKLRDLLVERWGDRVLADGQIDRSAVAGIVFEDPDELKWLESELHPRVGARVVEWRDTIGAEALVAVVEVPLLFEGEMSSLFDSTVAVIADDAVREQRLAERGQPGLAGREARQLPQSEKAERADHVIINDGSLEELEAAVAAVTEKESNAGLADG